MFIVYELVVSILLLNLLIAMMARTYQEIAATQLEWKRQVKISTVLFYKSDFSGPK